MEKEEAEIIIALKGTNGSGKSHLVRKVMDSYEARTLIKYPPEHGRKLRPMGYLCLGKPKGLFVAGHYEIANGGIDTIGDLNFAYELILEHHKLGMNVIYEGMNMTDGTTRILRLPPKDVRVILVNEPLKRCVESVRQRGHKISEKTIEKLYYKSQREISVLQNRGIKCLTLSRTAALKQLLQWLA